MRVSHKSLLTISLLWGGACLSQVYCAPVSDNGIASGSDIQLAKHKQRDEPSELDGKSARVPTSIPKKVTEIGISVLARPSSTNVDGNKPPNEDDDDDIYQYWVYWFEAFMEFIKCLGTAAKWLWENFLVYALFLVVTVFLGLGLVTAVVGCFIAAVDDHPTERTRLL